MTVVSTILIILITAFVAGAIVHRLGQPVILGFVVAGIALGPYTGGLTVTELIDAQLLSEVGVALLLFALGVEFSLSTTRTAVRVAFFGAPIQLVLIFFYAYFIGQLLSWTLQSSFWFGVSMVLSSPLVTLHTLSHLQLGETTVARLSRSILIVQNLVVVSLLFVVRQLQAGNNDIQTLALAAAEGVLFLGVLLFIGIFILPRLYAVIARTNHEFSLLVVLASGAVIVYSIFLYGLTFVEVAFIIGLLLSESELGSSALRILISMRDLFGALFFISAGMVLDLSFLGLNIALILLLVVLISAGKMLILAITTRAFGHDNADALAVALTLFQVSELSFIFARVAMNNGAIDSELYTMVITVGLITMLLTPFVARLALRFYPQIKRPSPPLSVS